MASGSPSVHAKANDYDGFVHVGGLGDETPGDADLFLLAEVAQLAKLVRLKFNAYAELIDSLPIFCG